jgi:cobalt/nickel transport system permease protein
MRPRLPLFLVAGLLVAAALAFFVSPYASSQPDGLNKVAIDEGFDGTESPHAAADLPTAGYEVSGVDDPGLSTGLAGVIGVAATFAICAGLLVVVRRAADRAPVDGSGPPAPRHAPSRS